MSHRALTLAAICLCGTAVLLIGRRTGIAQEAAAAKPAEVVRDQVKGSINHGSGNTPWRRVIGKAKALDAHTLEFADGTRIDLDITVPYPEQMGLAGDVLYPAGQEAAKYLQQLVGDRQVMCFGGDGPWSGYVGDTNLERAMVVGGWALADHSSLHADEIIARENRRGLWRGKFIQFDDWRAGVRLPGETPPAKLVDERQATALLRESAGSQQACAIVVARIIQDLPGTRRLDFPSGNYLTDDVLSQLPRLNQLEDLNLLDCGRISDAGLGCLKDMPGLKRLGYPHSGTDGGMEHVAQLKQLEELTFAWSNVTDAGFRHVGSLSRLRRLSLRHLKISDAGLAHLSGLQDLEVLETYQAGITDAAMVHLQPLTKLAYLDVGAAEVTDAGVLKLIGLKRLRILLAPDRVTAAAKTRLHEVLPDLKFEGRPDEIPRPAPAINLQSQRHAWEATWPGRVLAVSSGGG